MSVFPMGQSNDAYGMYFENINYSINKKGRNVNGIYKIRKFRY